MSEQALNDARLIARYASARGLLPADSALPAAINQAEASLAAGVVPSAQVQSLIIATNAAARAILPMVIERLRAEEWAASLSGPTKMVYIVWRNAVNFFTPATVYLLCAVLIVVVIAWTMQFNRLTGLAAELKATESEDLVSLLDDARNAQQALERLRKSALPPAAPARPPTRGGKPAPTKQQNASPEMTEAKRAEIEKQELALQVKLKKLRELDSKINIDRKAIGQTVDLASGEPRLWQIVLWTYGLSSTQKSASTANRESVPPKIVADERPQTTSQGSKKQPSKPAATSAAEDTIDPPPECDFSRTIEACVAFLFGRDHGLSIASPVQLQEAYEARRQADTLNVLLGTAILPVMYGLLGAGVFLLRGFLGESETSMSARQTIAATALLRLGLGGIAGLAIGWFWVPKAGENPFQTTPFALAFLAGFSIELLFSLLDRILNAINPRTPTSTS